MTRVRITMNEARIFLATSAIIESPFATIEHDFTDEDRTFKVDRRGFAGLFRIEMTRKMWVSIVNRKMTSIGWHTALVEIETLQPAAL